MNESEYKILKQKEFATLFDLLSAGVIDKPTAINMGRKWILDNELKIIDDQSKGGERCLHQQVYWNATKEMNICVLCNKELK